MSCRFPCRRVAAFLATAVLSLSGTALPAVAGAHAAAGAPVQAAPAGACADMSGFDLTRLLPPPPREGSPTEAMELRELLAIQAHRTPEESRRARADSKISIFRFADALGDPAAFTPARLPITTAFFRKFRSDESGVLGSAKRYYARRRPFVVDSRLHPVDPEPPSASYPSGHSTWATAAGLVLADMVPERRGQILARARAYAHNRVVGGVHFPSDVQAGELAGTAIDALLFACPRFEQAEAAAKVELRTALGLPPSPAH
ncbi:MAG TPA: phosphatase PAP2 family protein [Steroidobacteraceae bacterium]|nr:phosphatase PAP2 family protein [Steroidobacteraceae bacterium]